MKSIRFVVVTAILSIVAAYVIAPPDPWTYSYSLRALVIMLIVMPAYLIGRAHGRETGERDDEKNTSRRRWLQFSLKGLLVVVTLFAVFLGIYCERARRQLAIREGLDVMSTEIFFESEFDGTPWSNYRNQGMITGKSPLPSRLPWLRKLVGPDYVDTIVAVVVGTDDIDGVIPLLKNLPGLRTVYLRTSSFEPPTEDASKAIDSVLKKLRRELPHVELQCTGTPPIVG
jgi:hypothetical protein